MDTNKLLESLKIRGLIALNLVSMNNKATVTENIGM